MGKRQPGHIRSSRGLIVQEYQAGRGRLANEAAVGGRLGEGCNTRQTEQERSNETQPLQLHAPRGMPAQGGSRVKEERDEKRCCSRTEDSVTRQRSDEHRRCRSGPSTSGNCHAGGGKLDWSCTDLTRLGLQIAGIYVRPLVFPSCLIPGSASAVRKRYGVCTTFSATAG